MPNDWWIGRQRQTTMYKMTEIDKWEKNLTDNDRNKNIL